MQGWSLTTGEHRFPWELPFDLTVDDLTFRVDVSAVPTRNGQAFVLTLDQPRNEGVTLDQLDLTRTNKQTLTELLDNRHGVVGNVGYFRRNFETQRVLVQAMRDQGRRVYTLDEWSDRPIRGVHQCRTDAEVKLGLRQLGRAVLRQQPDVVLVPHLYAYDETTSTMLDAATAGCLVLAGMNSVPDAVFSTLAIVSWCCVHAPARSARAIAGHIRGCLAEAAIPAVCRNCSEEYHPPQRMIEALQMPAALAANAQFLRGQGCDHCGGSGVDGEVRVHELLVLDSELRTMIAEAALLPNFVREGIAVRERATSNGMVAIYEDVLRKVAAGLSPLDQVWNWCRHMPGCKTSMELHRGESHRWA